MVHEVQTSDLAANQVVCWGIRRTCDAATSFFWTPSSCQAPQRGHAPTGLRVGIVAELDGPEWARVRADAPAAVHDSWFKIWGRRAGYVILTVAVLMPWALIAWCRAQRSSSAPAALEEVWLQPNAESRSGLSHLQSMVTSTAGRTSGRGHHDAVAGRGVLTSWRECTCATTRHDQARTSP